MRKLTYSFFILFFCSNISDGAEPVNNWVKIENPYFEFMLPPDFKKQEVKGEDSFVGSFKSGKMELNFDYGLYSQDITSAPNLDFKYESKKIDGVEAKIYSYEKSGKFIVGTHFPETGARRFKSGDKLTMEITFADSNLSKSDIYRILESIRFHY